MTDTPTGYPDFPGKIGRTREESEPHWPTPQRAAPGSPNVVVVFMDDLGWSDIGCFGSEIETPNIDALASRGIRLNHYTTHPICSPARAALLTGRNAHSVATGWSACGSIRNGSSWRPRGRFSASTAGSSSDPTICRGARSMIGVIISP